MGMGVISIGKNEVIVSIVRMVIISVWFGFGWVGMVRIGLLEVIMFWGCLRCCSCVVFGIMYMDYGDIVCIDLFLVFEMIEDLWIWCIGD